jgi:CheY-like chemotaxis protein
LNNNGLSGFDTLENIMMKFIALIVEDDPIQRLVLSDLLKDEGLEVVECASAEAAELVLVATGNELLALVTDVELSGEMSGVELAQFAKRRFPSVNVVLVSGRGVPYVPQGTRFVKKPYSPDQLLQAVLQ